MPLKKKKNYNGNSTNNALLLNSGVVLFTFVKKWTLCSYNS